MTFICGDCQVELRGLNNEQSKQASLAPACIAVCIGAPLRVLHNTMLVLPLEAGESTCSKRKVEAWCQILVSRKVSL